MSRTEDPRARLLELLRTSLKGKARSIPLEPECSLRALGLDSLAIVMLVARFCEAEGIEVDSIDGDLSALRTVGDLLEAGERLLSRLGAGTSAVVR